MSCKAIGVVRIETERKRAPRRDNKARRSRRAKRHECGQPLRVEPFDRQGEERFARGGDQHRPSGVEFGEPAADADMPSRPEQSWKLRRPTAVIPRLPILTGRECRTPRGASHSGRKYVVFVRA